MQTRTQRSAALRSKPIPTTTCTKRLIRSRDVVPSCWRRRQRLISGHNGAVQSRTASRHAPCSIHLRLSLAALVACVVCRSIRNRISRRRDQLSCYRPRPDARQRSIVGSPWTEKVTSGEVRGRTGQHKLRRILRSRRISCWVT